MSDEIPLSNVSKIPLEGCHHWKDLLPSCSHQDQTHGVVLNQTRIDGNA